MNAPERLKTIARQLRQHEITSQQASVEIERIAVWLQRAGIAHIPPVPRPGSTPLRTNAIADEDAKRGLL